MRRVRDPRRRRRQRWLLRHYRQRTAYRWARELAERFADLERRGLVD